MGIGGRLATFRLFLIKIGDPCDSARTAEIFLGVPHTTTHGCLDTLKSRHKHLLCLRSYLIYKIEVGTRSHERRDFDFVL